MYGLLDSTQLKSWKTKKRRGKKEGRKEGKIKETNASLPSARLT